VNVPQVVEENGYTTHVSG